MLDSKLKEPTFKYGKPFPQESCKASLTTSANARVCLYDLQAPREIFPVF